MNEDTLIRDLDTLGVKYEIDPFEMNIQYYSAQIGEEAMIETKGKFTTDLEYAACQKWNDSSSNKVSGVRLRQKIYTKYVAEKEVLDFYRFAEGSIYFNNGFILSIESADNYTHIKQKLTLKSAKYRIPLTIEIDKVEHFINTKPLTEIMLSFMGTF